MSLTFKEMKKTHSILNIFKINGFKIIFQPFKKKHLQFSISRYKKQIANFEDLNKTISYLNNKTKINVYQLQTELEIIILYQEQDLTLEFKPFTDYECKFSIFDRGVFLKDFHNIEDSFLYIEDIPNIRYKTFVFP